MSEPERYVVERCSSCKAQVSHGAAAHFGDCPNMGKVFAVESICAAPVEESEGIPPEEPDPYA